VLDLVPKRDDNQRPTWRCKCDCGTIKEVAARHLKSGDIQSCGCLNISHGEFTIQQILDRNNIPYIKEYHPIDLEFNGRYDFAIVNDNNEILYFIEYDGKQHFDSYNGGYEYNREHDLIKNNYCYETGIPLIRIPYTIKDVTIEDLQLETSKYIMSEAKEKEYYAL